jgi:hypothetical protein
MVGRSTVGPLGWGPSRLAAVFQAASRLVILSGAKEPSPEAWLRPRQGGGVKVLCYNPLEMAALRGSGRTDFLQPPKLTQC